MDNLKHYFPLCWFQSNPLELPASSNFLRQNLVVYFLVEFFIDANMIDNTIEAFSGVTLETALTVVFVCLIVFINRSSETYQQVLTSILFCENVISVFSIPAIMWLTVSESTLSYGVLGLLIIWDVALVSYVIKYALGINFLAGLAVSALYFACTYGGAYALMVMIGS